MKINLGCGDDVRDGYVNMDLRKTKPTVVVGNVLDIPYADESFDEILAKDVYEHVSHLKSQQLLNHWVRKLKHGGKLIIITPCLMDIINGIHNNVNNLDLVHHYIVKLFGGQGYEHNFHYTSGHPKLMEKMLREAGIRGRINVQTGIDVHDDGQKKNMTNMKIEAVK